MAKGSNEGNGPWLGQSGGLGMDRERGHARELVVWSLVGVSQPGSLGWGGRPAG